MVDSTRKTESVDNYARMTKGDLVDEQNNQKWNAGFMFFKVCVIRTIIFHF